MSAHPIWLVGRSSEGFGFKPCVTTVDDGDVVPLTADDDPFDKEFGPPYFALYGVGNDGMLEHIADHDTYLDALSFAQKLAPSVALPLKPICFAE